MKTYLITTLIIWVLGILINTRELANSKSNSSTYVTLVTVLIHLVFIIWSTWLISNLPA